MKSKKWLISLLAVVMTITMMPSVAFAAGTGEPQGEIKIVTGDGAVEGNDAIVSSAELKWSQADPSIGRNEDGWWVGANIIAPETVTEVNVGKVKYSNDGSDDLKKSFGTNNDGKTPDGKYYMGCWLLVTPERLEKALNSDSELSLTYKFDWDGDGAADQIFKLRVKPDNIALKAKDNSKVDFKTENGAVIVKDGAGVPLEGMIELVKGEGTVEGNNVLVSEAELEWSPKDTSVGRNEDGWWVGVHIIAPDSIKENNIGKVMYSSKKEGALDKSFDRNNDGKKEDGRYYIGCWSPVKAENLKTALENGKNMSWTYRFDWNGDGETDQTFVITVKPDNITLNKDGNIDFMTQNKVIMVENGKDVHEHEFNALWISDDEKHWEECKCGEKGNVGLHDLVWSVTDEPTETETGLKIEYCSICGHTTQYVEIPATGTTEEPAGPEDPVNPEQPAGPEDKPAGPEQPSAPETKPADKPDTSVPKTDDSSNIALWASVMMLAGIAMTGTTVYGRKKMRSR